MKVLEEKEKSNGGKEKEREMWEQFRKLRDEIEEKLKRGGKARKAICTSY